MVEIAETRKRPAPRNVYVIVVRQPALGSYEIRPSSGALILLDQDLGKIKQRTRIVNRIIRRHFDELLRITPQTIAVVAQRAKCDSRDAQRRHASGGGKFHAHSQLASDENQADE